MVMLLPTCNNDQSIELFCKLDKGLTLLQTTYGYAYMYGGVLFTRMTFQPAHRTANFEDLHCDLNPPVP